MKIVTEIHQTHIAICSYTHAHAFLNAHVYILYVDMHKIMPSNCSECDKLSQTVLVK